MIIFPAHSRSQVDFLPPVYALNVTRPNTPRAAARSVSRGTLSTADAKE